MRLHASYGGQYTESKQDDITSKYAYSPNYYGWNGVTQTYKYSITANAYAQYVKEIGAHNFDIMVGGEGEPHRSGFRTLAGIDPYNGEPHDAKLREEQAWATHSSLVSYSTTFELYLSFTSRYMCLRLRSVPTVPLVSLMTTDGVTSLQWHWHGKSMKRHL